MSDREPRWLTILDVCRAGLAVTSFTWHRHEGFLRTWGTL